MNIESRTIVAVDIGNTSTSLAAYRTASNQAGGNDAGGNDAAIAMRPERIGPVERWGPDWTPEDLDESAGGPRTWVIASVNSRRANEFDEWLATHFPTESMQHLRRDQLNLPNVRFPDRVGIDRLLAAAAALAIRPFHVPKIIVDAGTAVTIDLVDEAGVFQGGSILPGAVAMTQALSSLAEALPAVSHDFFTQSEIPDALGKSTEEALASGLYWGMIGGIRETIQQLSRQLTAPPTVFTTGGDAEHLPIDGQWIPDLVLAGIAQVALRN
jgi:type III pantothenate kinase